MSLFYVFQSTNYQEEKNANIVFSPQRRSDNIKNIGYSNMTLIKKGDYIFHHANSYLRAISKTTDDCKESNMPIQLNETNEIWNRPAYLVNTQYYELEKPLLIKNYRKWIIDNYYKNGPFDMMGRGRQLYMTILPIQFALFFLEEAIKQQHNLQVIEFLTELKNEIINIEAENIEIDNYNDFEQIEIEQNINSQNQNPTWERRPRIAEYTNSPISSRIIPKRNPTIASNALKIANFLCEFNTSDRVFSRKNGLQNYTEPHHLIPISKQSEFENLSIDIEENIISLCSHCHNLLHYGKEEDKKPILRKLFNERKIGLRQSGIKITFQQLLSYY